MCDIINLLAEGHFKEDPTSIVLSTEPQFEVHVQKRSAGKKGKAAERQSFTFERCKEHELTVADLITESCTLSLEDESREVYLLIEAQYEIIDRKPESQDYPSDISESELMEMLTEVMSLMLLNKNDDVVKYASNLDKIDSDA